VTLGAKQGIQNLKLLKAPYNGKKGIPAAGKEVGISEPCARKYIREVEEIVKG
jgi:molybdenum-dependent DNA-binding transcriptional regulator ModE